MGGGWPLPASIGASGAIDALGPFSALSPAEDEQLLIDAGFGDPAVFYAALSMRGWVAHAGSANAHDAR